MTILNAILKIPELRKKVFYVLVILLLYRLGSHISIPGINVSALQDMFSNNSVLGFVNLFSGGALSRFSIFALGILPYINASIIMQLLTIIWPALKEIAEEGDAGRKQVAQYTRYLAVGLSFFQSIVMSIGFRAYILPDTSFTFFLFMQ